jgi:hypothetical protein
MRFKSLFTKKRQTKIVVFANMAYLRVLENWMLAMARIDIHDYTVISIDAELHAYLQGRGVTSLLRPCDTGLASLWVHRVRVLLELMEAGYDVIHSDADAVWLKDPRDYLYAIKADMLFSQGTYWPNDVHAQWGFVLCCGFFMLRSTPETIAFATALLRRVETDKDDQISCNRLLLEEGTVWADAADAYRLSFRGMEFVCSHAVRKGRCAKMKLALLPHAAFQRIFEPAQDVYVRHLISEKESGDILKVLGRHGCCFLSETAQGF